MKKFFVIADTHFGHGNIIRYCNRPFDNVETMNQTLIKNWNEVVSKHDIVFILGDFAFKKEIVKDITPLLNGHKILIKGNHDSFSNGFYRHCGFEEVSKYPIIFDFRIMSHEPLILTDTTPYFNFYGHTHNDSKYADNATSKCVSVERIDYKPFCFLEK